MLLALLLTIMLNVSAQNPYAEFDKDAAKYGVNVEFSGQQPKITDFITAYVNSVAEEEFFFCLDYIWEKYLQNKPLEENEKVVVDTKNGYVKMEDIVYDGHEVNQDVRTTAEMRYWECADQKHKIFAISVSQFIIDKDFAFDTDFNGLNFYVYNNDTHKMVYSNGYGLGLEKGIKTDTGEEVVTFDEEGCRTDALDPFAIFKLPQTGNYFKVILYNLPTKKEITVKWNGLKFEVQQ